MQDIIDLAATCLGIGVSFNALRIVIKKAYKSNAFKIKVITETNKVIVKFRQFRKGIKARIINYAKKKNPVLEKAIINIADYIYKWPLDKLNSKVFDKIIANSSCLLSPGAFIAGAIDYNMHGYYKGKLWKIKMPNWTKKVLQWL